MSNAHSNTEHDMDNDGETITSVDYKTPTTYFFDSWGGLYASCDGDHPKAEAFGPTGVSRPVVRPELDEMGLMGEKTPMVLALESGCLLEAEECHEWPILVAPKATIEITMFFQDDDSLGDFRGDRDVFASFADHYCDAIASRLEEEYPDARVSVDWTEGPGDCNVAYCATDDEAADNTIGDEIKATIGDDFDAAWETF